MRRQGAQARPLDDQALPRALADELDARFDPPLEFRMAHGRGDGLEQEVSREGQEARIELHRRAHVVQDHGLEIVVHHPARNAAEELQRLPVRPAECLHLLVQGDIDEDRPRPTERQEGDVVEIRRERAAPRRGSTRWAS
jgi:hypothetical protein